MERETWTFFIVVGPGIEPRALHMLGQQYPQSSLTSYIEMTLTELPRLALNPSSCLSQLRTWNYILAVLSIPTPPILMALVAPENILITYFYWLRVVSNVTQTLCCWACVYMGGGGRRGDPASSSGSGCLFLLSSQLCLTPAPSPSSRRSGGLPLNHIQQGICSGYQTIHF